MENRNQNQTEEEVLRQEVREDLSGFFNQITISNALIQRIIREEPRLRLRQGFSASHINQLLSRLGLRRRKHHMIYKVTQREMTIPIELTGNVVEMQLIPYEEIKQELSSMKPEVARTMTWIHIGAVQIMFKATYREGIPSPIDIAICDKRMESLRNSILGTITGDLCAGKVVEVVYPRIGYCLQDKDFSRVLTLHQDFKNRALMKEGNRPYSITYQVSYALSNSHHSELFSRDKYIEIPDIFEKVATATLPDMVELPMLQETDI